MKNNDEKWRCIEILSELRSNYSCFDETEEPYYRALSTGIKAIREQIAQEEKHKTENLTKELPACIIDVFEDFLEKKNVWIPNEDVDEEIKKADEYSCKEEARKEMGLANIYGEDFDYLMEQLMSTFDNFGIPVEDKWT